MTTDGGSKAGAGAWEKARNVIGIVLLVVISYRLGLDRGRAEKTWGEYTAVKAQYARIDKEYFALRQQYNQIETEYSALKSQYDAVQADYARLRAQYDRIEKQRTNAEKNAPKG